MLPISPTVFPMTSTRLWTGNILVKFVNLDHLVEVELLSPLSAPELYEVWMENEEILLRFRLPNILLHQSISHDQIENI